MTDDLIEEKNIPVPAGYQILNWFSGFGRQIGPLYDRMDAEGKVCRAFRVQEHHTNGMGNCHGGMLMAFADVAWGHVISIVRPRNHWVTVRLMTDFVSGGKVGDWVEGTSEIIGMEDDFVTVTGRIWCGERSIMTGTGVFKVLGERA